MFVAALVRVATKRKKGPDRSPWTKPAHHGYLQLAGRYRAGIEPVQDQLTVELLPERVAVNWMLPADIFDSLVVEVAVMTPAVVFVRLAT